LLEKAQQWDRRKVDFKNVINQVAEIIDPKGLPWTVRVGKVIGGEKPSGEIADFLGESVLSALWKD